MRPSSGRGGLSAPFPVCHLLTATPFLPSPQQISGVSVVLFVPAPPPPAETPPPPSPARRLHPPFSATDCWCISSFHPPPPQAGGRARCPWTCGASWRPFSPPTSSAPSRAPSGATSPAPGPLSPPPGRIFEFLSAGTRESVVGLRSQNQVV